MRERVKVGGRALCPTHLQNEKVPLTLAAQLSGRSISGMWRAIHSGKLKAVPFPAGRITLWQVRLGDLTEYTGLPLREEGLSIVEACLAWKPGEEIARVA